MSQPSHDLTLWRTPPLLGCSADLSLCVFRRQVSPREGSESDDSYREDTGSERSGTGEDWETLMRRLGREDSLEKAAPRSGPMHSSPARQISFTLQPENLQPPPPPRPAGKPPTSLDYLLPPPIGVLQAAVGGSAVMLMFMLCCCSARPQAAGPAAVFAVAAPNARPCCIHRCDPPSSLPSARQGCPTTRDTLDWAGNRRSLSAQIRIPTHRVLVCVGRPARSGRLQQRGHGQTSPQALPSEGRCSGWRTKPYDTPPRKTPPLLSAWCCWTLRCGLQAAVFFGPGARTGGGGNRGCGVGVRDGGDDGGQVAGR